MQVTDYTVVSESLLVLSSISSFLFLFLLLVSYHLTVIVDVEFGKLQARDMLQHLWTGPISNASVDVVQGSRSVEVRAVGVTKVNRLSVDLIKHI